MQEPTTMRACMSFHYDLNPNLVADAFLALDQESGHPTVTQMKLNKLLYLAQAQYLASTGQRLFDEHIEAYEHGPVVPSIIARFHGEKKRILVVDHPVSRPALPDDVQRFIEKVWKKYGDMTPSQLRNVSHHKASWTLTYTPEGRHTQIPDRLLARDFTEAAPQDRIYNDSIALVDVEAMEKHDPDEDARRLSTALKRVLV